MWAIRVLQWCIWRRVFGGVGVEEGHQLLLRMREVMEHVPQGRGWLVVVCVGVLLEAAGDGGRAHGCE